MNDTFSRFALALCLCAVLSPGCQTRNATVAVPVAADPPASAAEPIIGPCDPLPATEAEASPPLIVTPPDVAFDNGFRRGRALLGNGQHLAAIKQFAYLRDHATSSKSRDRAAIGLSMALHDSGNSSAALGVLEPLPDAPQTELEAKKCLFAGELYLHQKSPRLARNYLIRGLEFESSNQKSYRAAALFNLGKAMLAEDDLADARIAFAQAQDIFDHNGDEKNTRQCKAITADIDRVLQ